MPPRTEPTAEPPAGLVDALADHALELVGPARRDGHWIVRTPAGHGALAVVLPPRSPARTALLEARVAALRDLDHPSVAGLGVALPLDSGEVAVLHEEIPGPDLRTLLHARPIWAPGEVVGLVGSLCDALAAMHAAGVVHGDVSPGNVVLRPDGEPVLVDLLTGADPDELGTPGSAAPERGAGATAAGDVHGVARVGLRLLGRDDAGGDLTEEDVAARSRLVSLLHAAAAAVASDRPGAAELAASVRAVVPARAVPVPDVALLAGLALRDGGESDTVRRGRPVRARHRAAPSSPRAPLDRPRQRLRAGPPRPLRRAVVAAGAVLAVGAVTVTAAATSASWRASDGVAAEVSVPDAWSLPPAQAAAQQLTQVRARALQSGDATALAAVTAPGTSAARADRMLAAVSRQAATRLEPQPDRWVMTRVVSRADTPRGQPVQRVVVRTRTVVDSDGRLRALPARTSELTLRWSDGAWKVSEVSEVAP